METVLEYILLNYTWFLVGAIIILLAIIGYYAEKTNFGQGETEEKNNNDNLNIQDSVLEEGITNKIQQNNSINEINPETKKEVVEQVTTDAPIVNDNSRDEVFEKNFENFDKEFNEILPQKEIIDDELLDEIESLSLDKTQKIDLRDIPDLDDVELPKIKNLKSENEDIWKF